MKVRTNIIVSFIARNKVRAILESDESSTKVFVTEGCEGSSFIVSTEPTCLTTNPLRSILPLFVLWKSMRLHNLE